MTSWNLGVSALGVTLLLRCDVFSVTEPAVVVDVGPVGGTHGFAWHRKGTALPLGIEGISIHTESPDTLVCRVIRDTGADGPLRSPWHYGTAPRGYARTGCTGRLPDGDYVAHLHCAGTPFVKFRIEKDGSVTVRQRSSDL